MKEVVVYSLKIWLTSIFFGPVLHALLNPLFEPGPAHHNGFEYLALIASIMFSLPSLILLMIGTGLINSLYVSIAAKKIILSGMGIILTIIPIYLLKGGWNPWVVVWVISYGSFIVGGIWFYKFSSAEV